MAASERTQKPAASYSTGLYQIGPMGTPWQMPARPIQVLTLDDQIIEKIVKKTINAHRPEPVALPVEAPRTWFDVYGPLVGVWGFVLVLLAVYAVHHLVHH